VTVNFSRDTTRHRLLLSLTVHQQPSYVRHDDASAFLLGSIHTGRGAAPRHTAQRRRVRCEWRIRLLACSVVTLVENYNVSISSLLSGSFMYNVLCWRGCLGQVADLHVPQLMSVRYVYLSDTGSSG